MWILLWYSLVYRSASFETKSFLYEIFKTVKMWIVVFWFVTACSLVGGHQRLRGPHGVTARNTKINEKLLTLISCTDTGYLHIGLILMLEFLF
jgi:hypothetical protein